MQTKSGWKKRWGARLIISGVLTLALLAVSVAGLTAARAGVAPVRGLDYGPYRDGQNPNWGPYPSQAELQADMGLLKTGANALRTYGCQNISGIAAAADEAGLPLLQGIWLGSNDSGDAAEIQCALAQAAGHANVSGLVVGNESVLRGDRTAVQVCTIMEQVRAASGLPVTTGEPWHIWKDHPDLAACADFLLIHIHPYWECQSAENALAYVQQRYNELRALYPAKSVVIGETGWPSGGQGRSCPGLSDPTPQEQAAFVSALSAWAQASDVSYYYFDAFDEAWKCAGGPSVECRWGLFQTDRLPKPAWFELNASWPQYFPLVKFVEIE